MRRLFIFVSLGVFIGAALWVASTARPPRILGVSKPVKSALLDASGETLASFFEGIRPDPSFSPERLAAERRQRHSNATCGSAKRLGVLDTVFGVFVKTAQAAGDPCSDAFICTGSFITDGAASACPGPPCQGTHANIEWGLGPWYSGGWVTGPSCGPLWPDGSPCDGGCDQAACPRCGDNIPCDSNVSTPVENSPNRRSKIPQPPAGGG